MSDLIVLLRAPAACPKCGESLRDADGSAIRPMDKDYPALKAKLDELTFQRIKTGTIVCAVLSVLASVPLVHAFVTPLLFLQTWIWARPLVCSPYARHFSPSRRMVTRWLSRFFVFSLASLHTQWAIPGWHVVAFVGSPIIFVITCGTAWAYVRFHLQREHDRQPILLAEKLVLVVAAIVALGFLVAMIALALFLGGVIEAFTAK